MTIPTAAIDQLKASLKPGTKIVTPDSPDYEESLKRWSETIEFPAALVVYPTTPADVSTTVLFSKAQHLELAIKGGGHATRGSSSTAGGLCLDLSHMQHVTVHPFSAPHPVYKTATITAQGGALWSHVDIAAAAHGLATVGGTVNHTGVGGLTLGGGYGFLTGQYGLTIDNLLEVEIVLASGEIVIASESQNEDLFWAVRGAGASFGVVTSFTFRAYEQKDPVWGGMMAFPKHKLAQVVEFGNHVLAVSKGEVAMVMVFAAPPPKNTPLVIAVAFYNGPEAAARSFFAPLLDAEPLFNLTRPMPYASVNEMLLSVASHGDRKCQKGASFLPPMSPSFASELFTEFEAFIEKTPAAARTILLFEGFAPGKILERGQSEMAFANRGVYGNVLVGLRWVGSEFDTVCREWARYMDGVLNRELERRLKEEEDKSKEKGKGGVDEVTRVGSREYINYDGLGASAKRFFGVNYERVVELKTKYDPENVFCKSIADLLPRGLEKVDGNGAAVNGLKN